MASRSFVTGDIGQCHRYDTGDMYDGTAVPTVTLDGRKIVLTAMDWSAIVPTYGRFPPGLPFWLRLAYACRTTLPRQVPPRLPGCFF